MRRIENHWMSTTANATASPIATPAQSHADRNHPCWVAASIDTKPANANKTRARSTPPSRGAALASGFAAMRHTEPAMPPSVMPAIATVASLPSSAWSISHCTPASAHGNRTSAASSTPAAAMPIARRVTLAEPRRSSALTSSTRTAAASTAAAGNHRRAGTLNTSSQFTDWSFSVCKLGSTYWLASSRPIGHATAIVVAATTTTLNSTQPSASNTARTKPPGSFSR